MTALVTDSFTRANAANLGANWTIITGETAMQIVSNHAEPTSFSSGDSGEFYSAITFPADQYSQIILVDEFGATGGSGPALMVRVASGARTYYRWAFALNGTWELGKSIAGVFTSLATGTAAGFAVNDIIKIQIAGTTIKLFRNATQIGSNVIDSSIASGYPGIGYSTAGQTVTLINWQGGDLADTLFAQALL